MDILLLLLLPLLVWAIIIYNKLVRDKNRVLAAWSDIDVAAFMEGLEDWDIRRRATAMAMVMEEAGSDVEAHLFPASALDNPPTASFAEHILRHGTPILTPQ